MGLIIRDLIVKEEINLADLSGKIIAIDSMNMLYQFITTIRGPNGTMLTDNNGHPTSHLIGLFNRTVTFLEHGIKPIFIFDGKAPEIKRKTWEKRSAIKAEALLKLKEAELTGDEDDIKKYAVRTAILTKEMCADAKIVIAALGCPILQAPSEGEAQTAHLVKIGKAYASISQDYDNLIFGCPRLIRNLSSEGKRKKPGTLAYEPIKPEMIMLEKVLSNLKLTLEQLQILAIIIGTDYNPGGIKGIGPKKALKLLHEHGTNYPAIFDKVEWASQYPDLSWKDLLITIQTIPVTSDGEFEWKSWDQNELIELLVHQHNFSMDRVRARLEKLKNTKKEKTQTGLNKFF